jgi:hypothetical protein
MKPDPEPLLEQLTPRGGPADLRARVLDRIGKELEAGSGRGWQRWCGLAVAAGLVVGSILNVWICSRQERRLAKLYGPTPIPAAIREIAQAVESITDKQTAQWLEQRFAAAHHPQFSLPEHIQYLEAFLRDLETSWKEVRRERS